jgi:hypothetical protein
MNTDGHRGDDRFVDQLTRRLDARAERVDPAETGHPPDEDAALADVFDEVVHELGEEATWSGVPFGLRDAVLGCVRTEADAADTPPVTEPADPPSLAEARNRRSPRARRWLLAVPAAAAVALVFTVGVLAVERALEPRGESYSAAGTGLAPAATATVSVLPAPSGFKVSVDAEGLPAAAPGSYYAAWLQGPTGTVPLGSFHGRKTGAAIALWSGVDPAAYPDFLVTLQAEGDAPMPSGQVVMTATLRR